MASQKNSKNPPPATVQNFPVIGVGASAGGLEAFKRFLRAIPADSGMAYVLVQHLDPSHESMLSEILAQVTSIPVNEITDEIHLAPNHIYVIPSNKILSTFDGMLKIAPREKIKKNLAIDVFFTSLAHVHKRLAAGVVLSGTGSDGTVGLEAIKENGGYTLAQDQESAAFGEMPLSAVNAGVVDFVMPPQQMPEKLLELRDDILSPDGEASLEDQGVFRQIISLLLQHSGVDFTHYKQTTVQRRILRRMAMAKIESPSAYLTGLYDDRTERQALFQDMLIAVTSFFRDPDYFEALGEAVFAELFKNKSDDEPIRIWVVGCSTGQEAFSIAIRLKEFLGEQFLETQIQIFATDISEIAIKKARAGLYTKSEVQMVSATRLAENFTKTKGGYQVNKSIRDVCIFAIQNFLKDPPFAKMDLITCRNVLIYMDSFLQRKALTTFHYALHKHGSLMLGKSESTSIVSELFAASQQNDKIYVRKSVPNRMIYLTEGKQKVLAKENKKRQNDEVPQTSFRKAAEMALLERHTPASVVVNELMDIVHIHGTIAPFLESSAGKPTFNLFKMAREGLGFELRNALHKVKTDNIVFKKEGIPSRYNGEQHLVSIEASLLKNTFEPCFLIVFRQSSLVVPHTGQGPQQQADESQLRISQLENELAQVREDMRSITDEQEAANEELQSSSEELESSSEEMKSLNEELETSREELQSSNEELVILNQELFEKQQQLNTARLYSEAIVTTIREPLIILDKSLRVKTANSAFYKQFNFGSHEIEGHLFYELHDDQWDNRQLRPLLEEILPKNTQVEDFEIVLNFPSLGQRTMLLNARQIVNENTAERLILVAIEDITERKLTEQRLKTFSDELETKVKERTADLMQTNVQLEQFAHAASHDLQEPLRKIVTFSNRLQSRHRDEFSDEVDVYLKKIQGASTRMSKLIQDLLNYSYLINQQQLFAAVDLDETLKGILLDFELLIEEKKAIVNAEVLPIIEAVPLQMNQLFFNLVSNALKFTKESVPPVIDIFSSPLSPEEIDQHPALKSGVSYCKIIVRDNGIGFDQKYDQQVFTIFQRLNKPSEYPGTGIGLALCKKIIENHHGEIYVKSQENQGAEFHIILPTGKL